MRPWGTSIRDGRFRRSARARAAAPSRHDQDRRVLCPDGKLLFIEHVRADDEPRLARWQDRLEAPWRAFGEGCRCNQPTLTLLDEAGLRPSRLGHDRWRGMPRIVAPLIIGEAA
jgi:hypothetical protein